jgi:hypothetical protein
MIYKALQLVTEQLNGYLKLSFKLRDDIAFLSPIKDADKVYPSNRVSVTLIGLERETSGGINFQRTVISDSTVKRTAPAWQMNVNILISVIFQDKQYEDSLQMLSGILSFIQKNNMITSQDQATSFAIDPVNLSIQELANLWGICGDSYFPSMACRLRVLTVDENEILDLSGIMKTRDLTTGTKNNDQ